MISETAGIIWYRSSASRSIPGRASDIPSAPTASGRARPKSCRRAGRSGCWRSCTDTDGGLFCRPSASAGREVLATEPEDAPGDGAQVVADDQVEGVRVRGHRGDVARRIAGTRPRMATGVHLRHSTASLLLMAGADISAVQKILRHTDPRLTTETYGHLEPNYLRQQIDRLSLGGSGSLAANLLLGRGNGSPE